jgi:PAS domain-containing protein
MDEVGQETHLESLLARRQFVDELATGLMLFNADNMVIDCNRAGAKLFGAEVDQMVGRVSLDLQWGAVREDGSPFPSNELPVTATLRTGEPCFDVVVGIDIPGGGGVGGSQSALTRSTSTHRSRVSSVRPSTSPSDSKENVL